MHVTTVQQQYDEMIKDGWSIEQVQEYASALGNQPLLILAINKRVERDQAAVLDLPFVHVEVKFKTDPAFARLHGWTKNHLYCEFFWCGKWRGAGFLTQKARERGDHLGTIARCLEVNALLKPAQIEQCVFIDVTITSNLA